MGWKSSENSVSELSGLLCGSLEGKNAGRDADNAGPTCEVSEGSLRVP